MINTVSHKSMRESIEVEIGAYDFEGRRIIGLTRNLTYHIQPKKGIFDELMRLLEKHKDQLKGYLKQVNCRIGFITNYKDIRFFEFSGIFDVTGMNHLHLLFVTLEKLSAVSLENGIEIAQLWAFLQMCAKL